MPTKIEGLAQLIRKAKGDPQFFHSLVWDTERTLGSVDFLSREEKAAIMRINPEDLVVALASGHLSTGADDGGCGNSCAQTSHCTYTCSVSTVTTNPASLVSNPAAELAVRIQNEIASGRFSHFTR